MTLNYNTVMSGGVERRYVLRLPENYDNTRPYRLILGLHGATNNASHVAGNPAFFGLYELSEGSTIFIAPEAVGGLWSADTDVTFIDDILEQVQAQLCVDPSRIVLQGFSQGAAMARYAACQRPGVFQATVAHSAGGVTMPSSCDPIPFLGSLGLGESSGGAQSGQTDFFAEAAGCQVETLPTAPSGGHVCTTYPGCPEDAPVRWCSFDGDHTPLPNDAGQNSSWMPAEVWAFLSQL
jgi:poly(3-hydroxybutyrate) depolymerase